MNNISNIQTSQPVFQGRRIQRAKNFIPALIDRVFNPRKITLAERFAEKYRGVDIAQYLNQKQSVEEARDIIAHETELWNYDFLRSLNKVLDEDLAKKAYSAL